MHILEQFNRGLFDYLIATDDSVVQSQDDAIVKEEKEEDEADESESESDDASSSSASSSSDEEDDDDDDDEQPAEKKQKTTITKEKKKQKQKQKKVTKQANASGVARGIDFQDVVSVVNFDFPGTVKQYIHRVGRTARGGSSGFAFSFASDDAEERTLQAVRATQLAAAKRNKERVASAAALGQDVKPDLQVMQFNRAHVEAFRYRVAARIRTITKSTIRTARLKEIKMEMLNSQRLQAHFEDNPRERELLRHDTVIRPNHVPAGLAHVPSYLLPTTVTIAHPEITASSAQYRSKDSSRSAKRRRRKQRHAASQMASSIFGQKQNNSNPLTSFAYHSSSGNGSGSGVVQMSGTAAPVSVRGNLSVSTVGFHDSAKKSAAAATASATTTRRKWKSRASSSKSKSSASALGKRRR
jgi:ATP-dependent RNA helicase DDX56/DBP9